MANRTRTFKQGFPLSRIYQDDLEARFSQKIYRWATLNELDLKLHDAWVQIYRNWFPDQRMPGELEDWYINSGRDIDALYLGSAARYP